jgi:CheY-like chemotaxis protein
MKDEFLATLSHELRTPLNAILGWAQMLRMTELEPATAARAYETIERNARAQAQLIADLLDVSRIITGKLRLELGAVDLERVIAAVLDTVRPALDAKRISIAVELDPRAGAVRGDADRLQQVVWNLLSNAIKFTPAGGRVGIRLARADGAVEIQVSDSGAGIQPEFLPYVFDRFRQADSATTRSHGGLGLGLSIARHLVELHGGTIAADSEGPGRGSVFTITVPAEPAPAALATGKGAAALAWEGDRALDGVRVLIVEDEADTRELLGRMLARCGAEVSEAGSAAQALAALDAMSANGTGRLPHVLVSDIGMPQEDGFALLARLRERSPERGGAIPVMALTAYARSEDRHRALAAGFAAHLAKPVEPQDLVATVARLARAAG